LKFSVIPTVLILTVDDAREEFRLRGYSNDLESLLDQIEETGQYVENNALEILQDSKDEGTRKLAV
jgi:hypothetical protein